MTCSADEADVNEEGVAFFEDGDCHLVCIICGYQEDFLIPAGSVLQIRRVKVGSVQQGVRPA